MSKQDNFKWRKNYVKKSEPAQPKKRGKPLPKIAWTENQKAKYDKAIKNHNAKIDYWAKKYAEEGNYKAVASLPEKVRKRTLKDKHGNIIQKGLNDVIQTRADLEREIRSLQRFSRKGAEEVVAVPLENGGTAENIMATRWEIDDTLRRVERLNKERALRRSEIEDIDMKSRGEPTGNKRGQVGMGSQDTNLLNPIVAYTRTMSNEERRRKRRAIVNESASDYWDNRYNILKEAYIKGVESEYTGEEDVDDVIEAIRNMDTRKFREIFEAEGGSTVFEYVYPEGRKNEVDGSGSRKIDKDSERYRDYSEALRNIWLDYDTQKKVYVDKIRSRFGKNANNIIKHIKKMPTDQFRDIYNQAGSYRNINDKVSLDVLSAVWGFKNN